MRRMAVIGVLLASCTLAVAQDSPDGGDTSSSQGGNWFTRMFGFGAKPEPKKAAEKKKSEPRSTVEPAASNRAREEESLNRRNQVILKLREIAIRTSDAVLLRKADELDERANALYFQRTGGVPGGDGAPVPDLSTSHGEKKSRSPVHSVDAGTQGE